jgi:hypothetical protein
MSLCDVKVDHVRVAAGPLARADVVDFVHAWRN